MNLYQMMMEYHKLRTYSPEVYAKHLAIQTIGHTLGWNSNNLTQVPRGTIHTTYTVLLGESGKTKKSTAQNDIFAELIPFDYKGPSSFSPEGLLNEMSVRPQLICPLGELSLILRGIKHGGHMSNFKEVANDLSNRRTAYQKLLVSKTYKLLNPYLSLSSTCTEEEFTENLTIDMVTGGFLPRWIMVYSDRPERKRMKLPVNIDLIEHFLKMVFINLYKDFKDIKPQFELTEDAEDLLWETQCKWEDEPRYQHIQPYVSRYLEYAVRYADILYVCSKVHTSLTSLTTITTLSTLSELTNEIHDTTVESFRPLTARVSVNLVNSVILDKSISLIQPCLNYSAKIVNYILEHETVAKVLRVLDGKKEMNRSEALRRTHLTAQEFDCALKTLEQRNEFQTRIEISGEGQARKSRQIIEKVK